MSLLSIVQSVAQKVGLATPQVGVSSADPKVLQIVAFVNEDGKELGKRHSWQALRAEATFNTVNAENQGSILTLTGPDFAFIVNETVWDRTTRRPVFGPKTPAEWQQLKAQLMQGPWYQFTLRGNNILFIPVPPAGHTIFFEWITKYWCTDTSGATGKLAMTADTDVSKLDEDFHILGGIWRFKAANKLDYGEDFDKYERAFADATSRDGIKARLNLAGAQSDIYPGILVPSGNWPISGEPSA